ncbi:hypothetical protein KTH71_15725 [Acinetobacter sp. WU_MDCI_Axc73]|nr:hypothetical protein [Acinetobacter sp. WU_MDCI_Axc73]
MKAIHETHQIFFFSKNTELSATPANITKILNALTPFGLMPTLNNEFDLTTASKKQILSMIHTDESLRVELPSSGIMISKDGGTSNDFIRLAISILEALRPLIPLVRSNRISLINTKFFAGTEAQFKETYNRLFTYKTVSPIEWENRIVLREKADVIGEEINKISTIRRVELRSPFINQSENTDVIMFEIDTNTLANNQENRFSLDQAFDVYKYFNQVQGNLFEELKRYE